jgi:hypothetical protein
MRTKDEMEKYWNSREIGWVKANSRKKPLTKFNVTINGNVVLNKTENFHESKVEVFGRNEKDIRNNFRMNADYIVYDKKMNTLKNKLLKENPGFSANKQITYTIRKA